MAGQSWGTPDFSCKIAFWDFPSPLLFNYRTELTSASQNRDDSTRGKLSNFLVKKWIRQTTRVITNLVHLYTINPIVGEFPKKNGMLRQKTNRKSNKIKDFFSAFLKCQYEGGWSLCVSNTDSLSQPWSSKSSSRKHYWICGACSREQKKGFQPARIFMQPIIDWGTNFFREETRDKC